MSKLSVNVSYSDENRTVMDAESVEGGLHLSIDNGSVIHFTYLDFMEWAGTVTKMLAREQRHQPTPEPLPPAWVRTPHVGPDAQEVEQG